MNFVPQNTAEQPAHADQERHALSAERQRLDEFLYAITHDFKASLRALQEVPAWVQEDIEALGVELPASTKQDFVFMQRAAKTLTTLLDGLTEVSRVGRLPGPLVTADLAETAERVWSEIEGAERFTLDCRGARQSVRVPEADLHRVLKAILENAIHHHHHAETGCVLVSARRLGNRVELKIEDDGPGIAFEHREKVLKPLCMLQRRDETGRAGLGLTLARQVVESLNGQLVIGEGHNGVGCAVAFDLPAPSCQLVSS
ncbi:MAG: sensor histidine kinase [Pseudomonadota bacterium]